MVNVLACLLLVFARLITILVFSAQGSEDGVPAIFGKSLVTIESGSMEPTYKQGDLVFMTKLSHEEKLSLEPGNIITYRAPIEINKDGMLGDINTHRIVGYEGNSYITQGDNKLTNPVPDNQGEKPYVVYFTDVIGGVEEDDAIGGLGGVIAFLHSSLGFLLCIVLPLALFFLYELYRFIVILLEERAKKNPQPAGISAADEEEIKRRAIEEYLKAQAAQSAEPAQDNADQGNEN